MRFSTISADSGQRENRAEQRWSPVIGGRERGERSDDHSPAHRIAPHSKHQQWPVPARSGPDWQCTARRPPQRAGREGRAQAWLHSAQHTRRRRGAPERRESVTRDTVASCAHSRGPWVAAWILEAAAAAVAPRIVRWPTAETRQGELSEHRTRAEEHLRQHGGMPSRRRLRLLLSERDCVIAAQRQRVVRASHRPVRAATAQRKGNGSGKQSVVSQASRLHSLRVPRAFDAQAQYGLLRVLGWHSVEDARTHRGARLTPRPRRWVAGVIGGPKAEG